VTVPEPPDEAAEQTVPAVVSNTFFTAMNQILHDNAFNGVWNIFGLLIPAIVIAIGFTYLSKMK
jgi:hypothetical protein